MALWRLWNANPSLQTSQSTFYDPTWKKTCKWERGTIPLSIQDSYKCVTLESYQRPELKRIFLHRAKLMTWSSMLLERSRTAMISLWLTRCQLKLWFVSICQISRHTCSDTICAVKNYLLKESKTFIIVSSKNSSMLWTWWYLSKPQKFCKKRFCG